MVCVTDCSLCKHSRKIKIDNWIPTCDAFPNGQPLDWDYGRVKDIKECNNGIGFEPKENTDKPSK